MRKVWIKVWNGGVVNYEWCEDEVIGFIDLVCCCIALKYMLGSYCIFAGVGLGLG